MGTSTSAFPPPSSQTCGTTGKAKQLELERLRQDREWAFVGQADITTLLERINGFPPAQKRAAHLCISRNMPKMITLHTTCNGCEESNPRVVYYRCLQCIDFDLCRKCVGNDKPLRNRGEHTLKHHMIDVKILCDGCKAYIVGTRFKCTMCDDLDLCLLRHEDKKEPHSHDSSHHMNMIPFYCVTGEKLARDAVTIDKLNGKKVTSDEISVDSINSMFGRVGESYDVVKEMQTKATSLVSRFKGSTWRNAELFIIGGGIDVIFTAGYGKLKAMVLRENDDIIRVYYDVKNQ